MLVNCLVMPHLRNLPLCKGALYPWLLHASDTGFSSYSAIAARSKSWVPCLSYRCK